MTIFETEEEYRTLFESTYCNPSKPIITHDGITVSFHKSKFDHAFFESVNRKKADKSQFSVARAERILWIKQTLEDASSKLYVGWDKSKKTYDKSHRVAVVQGDYVVVINILNATKAVFVTAYRADNSISKIKSSPEWT